MDRPVQRGARIGIAVARRATWPARALAARGPDRAALDAHCSTEHFRRLVPRIDRCQRSPGTYLLMNLVE